ncbi:uncharacterized protein LOC110063966 isoform X1 [Orbicella faveolata]|uniref:uncharacterized protein LOC110063966 isoform X1 n=1 Tax=Orbicella faveolata TaxID=48498 RepID=UPI0009E64ED4|nr:uncharacterized protein LOC110063966 isoform X1 [Orbicella faveolata]
MKAVEKDVEDIFAEMELFLVDIAGDRSLNEEQRLRRDTLAEKVLSFRRQKDVLKSASSYTCSSCLSRAYVEQVSNVAWPKVKYNRPRSNSYPLIKRLNPLPRVIEEDETAEIEKPALPHTRVPQVQTLNWTDTKLSDEWLYKINRLRSTLTSLDSSRAKGSDRAERMPGEKRSSVDKRAAFEASNQDSPAGCKSESIERLRRVVKEDHIRDRPCVRNKPISKTDHVRKPDSTYISLISGFTQKESQRRSHDDEAHNHTKDSDSKKEKNCKNLKCIQMNMFVPRNLFCSSQRSTRRQMSNSSEYIQQIASLGC